MPQPQASCPFSALEAPASLTWPSPGSQGPIPLPGQMASARLALCMTFVSADILLFEYKYARICPLSFSLIRFFFSLLDF